MAGGGISATPGAGRAQIIRGQTYEQYSPQWYEAMDQNRIDKGTNLGKTTKAAYDAMGNPADTSSSSSSSSGGGLSGIASNLPPRVGDEGGGGGDYSKFGGGDSPIPLLSKPDQSAAEAATFGKAKDQVGQTTAGSLAGLRSALAGRGMLGSGAEYRGTQGVFTKGQGELGDVSRQQAVTHLGNEMEIDKANQAAGLTGRGQDITRRGQNMDYSSTHRGQDITQRGQDIQFAESDAQMKMTKSLQEAAQRQAILQGIMGAINGPTLY